MVSTECNILRVVDITCASLQAEIDDLHSANSNMEDGEFLLIILCFPVVTVSSMHCYLEPICG